MFKSGQTSIQITDMFKTWVCQISHPGFMHKKFEPYSEIQDVGKFQNS